MVTLEDDTLLGTGRVRMNFAVPHFISAAKFSRSVAEIEKANEGQPFGVFYEDILAYASGCLLTCVAGLESYINELFVERHTVFKALSSDLTDQLWEIIEEKPILEKFDLALGLRGKPRLNRGAEPYQSAYLVVRLRNALTHFKPEWHDEQVDHKKLSDQLASLFEPSPYFPASETFFPRRWATHSGTQWAVNSCVAFIEDFESLGELKPKLKKFKQRLAP